MDAAARCLFLHIGSQATRIKCQQGVNEPLRFHCLESFCIDGHHPAGERAAPCFLKLVLAARSVPRAIPTFATNGEKKVLTGRNSSPEAFGFISLCLCWGIKIRKCLLPFYNGVR